jgi:L-cystine uptake protein TcyP (sodium:dicarboxylate symporter family)
VTYFLLGAYAISCALVGLVLGFNGERIWLLAAFIVASVVAIQVGFFVALLLRG